MKKTISSLILFGTIAIGGEEYTYKTEMVGTLDNNIAHGFTLNIDEASNIVAADNQTPDKLEGYYTLSELTYESRTSSHNSLTSGSFSLLVIDNNRKIVGWSSNSNENSYNTSYTFNFSNVTINTSSTYTLAAVNADVIAAAQKGWYYHGGKDDVTADSTTSIITGGLQTIGIRVDLHRDDSNTTDIDEAINTSGANLVTALNLDSAISTQGVIYTSIKLIPEPTTATLSLLALAGLAARRRRR